MYVGLHLAGREHDAFLAAQQEYFRTGGPTPDYLESMARRTSYLQWIFLGSMLIAGVLVIILMGVGVLKSRRYRLDRQGLWRSRWFWGWVGPIRADHVVSLQRNIQPSPIIARGNPLAQALILVARFSRSFDYAIVWLDNDDGKKPVGRVLDGVYRPAEARTYLLVFERLLETNPDFERQLLTWIH